MTNTARTALEKIGTLYKRTAGEPYTTYNGGISNTYYENCTYEVLAKLEQDMLELIGEDETDPSPVATGRTHNKAIRNELRAARRSAIKDYFRQG